MASTPASDGLKKAEAIFRKTSRRSANNVEIVERSRTMEKKGKIGMAGVHVWNEQPTKQNYELHGAIRQGDAAKCHALIDAGADVNAVDGTGVSPLLVACEIGRVELVKCLIEGGAEINFRKRNGTTALHIASASGRLAVLELLIKDGADLDAVTSGSTTSVFVAAAGGHATLVKKLCEAGVCIDQQNHRGWTPLHAACQSGNPDAIEVLLHYGTDVEAVTSGTCSTPLHVAAMNGNMQAAEMLIDVGGACMDARQADNFTPLMLACNAGFLPIVQMLLKKGAEPDAMGANLRTAAHIAAVGGHASILRELLDCGADKNAKSDSGSTPLLLATNGGHIEAVEVLVSRKALVYDPNSQKPSPVLVATQRGNTQIVEIFLQSVGLDITLKEEPKPLLNIAALFGHLPIVKLLIQFGADPLLCEKERSMNALHEASLKGRLDIVRYLVKLGLDVDVKTAAEETSLHLAAKSGHVDVAEYLLKHGAYVKQYRASGHTALHFAAARGDIPLARLLLDAGADMEASHSEGGTPLYISAERGQVYMTRFLLKRGANVDQLCTEQCRTPLHVASAMGHLAVIEALLTAGANTHAKNSLFQRPEEVVGSRKALTVVERGLIDSTFSRHKKNKKRTEKKMGKELLPKECSLKKRQSESPRCQEITPDRRASARALPKHTVLDVENGTDPRNEEVESVEEPLSPRPELKKSPANYSSRHASSESPSAVTRKPSIVDQIAARRTAEGFRLFDIKEFISNPSQDAATVYSEGHLKEKASTTRISRRPSFGWHRLARQPGSARSDYQYSVTESPTRTPLVRTDTRRLSRSGSLSGARIPLSRSNSKASSVSTPQHSNAVSTSKTTHDPPLSRREASGVDSSSEHKPSRVFKRFPKVKRSSMSQDFGTQTDKSSVRSMKSDSNKENLYAKGRPALFVAANNGNIGMVERLLSSGADPDVRVEEHGWTPLYASARNGHGEIVRKLLGYGAEINKTINSGATALHGACAFGHSQVADVLIERGARLDATTKHGELPLHTAARNGYMHVVSLLLSADDSLIDQKRFSDGSTALHLAVEKQWAGAVKELIDWGANPGIAKEDGITPLYMTSIPGNKSIAQMILNSTVPFDVNFQTVEKWTALHVACARGDLEMVRLLLRSKADPTLKTNMDMTPSDVICEWVTADGGRTQRIREIIERPPTETSYRLVEAAAQGDVKQVKSLLDDGADVNVFGDEGLTPLLYAVRNGHIAAVNFLVLRKARVNLASCPGSVSALHYAVLGSSHQLVEFLLSNGGDAKAQDEAGQTPLHYACQRGFSMAISVLLCYKADVHANDKHGKTPLFMAAASNCYEAASLLLRNHAYPSCAAADGNTPLHAAAEAGGDETVHLLLTNRCDPNARNARKETPLYLAAKNGHSSIVQRLMAHDITIDAQDKEGDTALHVACMFGHLEVIEALLCSPHITARLKNKKGLTCHQVIGKLAGDKLEKHTREHIALILNRSNDKQYEEPPSAEEKRGHSDFVSDVDSFRCPLTKKIMKNPVIASDGHTYEYEAIVTWIKTKGTSPINGMKLSNTALHQNNKLKSKIDSWRAPSKRCRA